MDDNLRKVCEELSGIGERLLGNPKEENVKQKIVIPLLEALGHKGKMIFEYGSGKEIDIFLEGLPKGTQVIVETKKLGEDLDKWIEKLESYSRSVDALIAVISNGEELRIYSKIPGFYFEESLLYRFGLSELRDKQNLETLEKLLSRQSLMSLEVFKSLEDRKNEIRQVHNEIENLRKYFAQDKTIREEKIKLLQIEIEKEKQTILEKEQTLTDDVDSYFYILGVPKITNVMPEKNKPISEYQKTETVIPQFRPSSSKGRAFKDAILEILLEANGPVDSNEIVERIGQRFRNQLTEYELEREQSGQIRWIHYVHAARQHLVSGGLLLKDTPRGQWQISEKGKRVVKENGKGQVRN